MRGCYDGLESAEELPLSKAKFNSSFLTAARKSWLHVACLGYRNWERLFCALCMRTHEPPAKKGRDVFWRGQARTDEDKLKLHEQSKLHLENACFKKDGLTLHGYRHVFDINTCCFLGFVLGKSMFLFGGKFPTKLALTGW